MYPLIDFRSDAQDLTAKAFAEKYARFFFVYIGPGGGSWTEDTNWMSAQTATVQLNGKEEVLGSWALPLAKRPGNPNPKQISIGRARTCDLALRYAFISKLHAHLIESQHRYSLQDQGSSNGTKVNGVPLPRGESVGLEPGDRISFGQLELRFVAAEAFHAELRRAEPPSSSTAFGVRPRFDES